jgi:hypothetical protein
LWLLVAVMAALGGLDLVGTLLAKEWSAERNPWLFIGGALSFLVLFSTFALGLRVAEMSTVTFGWIVAVQVGVLVIERVRYGVELPTGKWAAIVVIVLLQAYLVLGPSTSNAAGAADVPARIRTAHLVSPD